MLTVLTFLPWQQVWIRARGATTARPLRKAFLHESTDEATTHRRLILTSNGLKSQELIDEFREMLGPDVGSACCVYIPTAAYAEGADEMFVQERVQRLFGFGFRDVVVVDVSGEEGPKMEQKLDSLPFKVAAIYLEYGNTYFLRHHLRTSGADRLLQQYAENGTIMVGSSAGSIVLGRTVQTAFWKNWDDKTGGGTLEVDWLDPEMAAGLNLCSGRSIFPHANGPYASKAWQDACQETHGHTDHEVVRLADGQALILDGEEARIVGYVIDREEIAL